MTQKETWACYFVPESFVELKQFALHSNYVCLLEGHRTGLGKKRSISQVKSLLYGQHTTGRMAGFVKRAGVSVIAPEYRDAPVKGSMYVFAGATAGSVDRADAR
jgi:hypothetical protein